MQMSNQIQNVISDFHCVFCKYFSAQYGLFSKPEKWKTAVGNKVFRALPTDLSISFDCTLHYLLIPKQSAYGLSLSTLKLIPD